MESIKSLSEQIRIIMMAMLLVLGTILVRNQNKLPAYYLPAVDAAATSEAFYESKIRGDADWKPVGHGEEGIVSDLPRIAAGAVIDLESGEVLWSKNLEKRISPASLSKLATLMTALDLGSLDKTISVSESASEQIPTKLGLRPAERLTLEEAAAASILTSANDAAEAIADFLGDEVGGGKAAFMKLVNKKLEKIGAYNSHFATPTGLDDPNHFSTVYDLAIIAQEVKANYPALNKLASTEYKKLDADSNHKVFDLPNWNALLGTYPGVDGLKIGYTENAGHSTIVTASREGKKLMAIVVGAKSIEDREIAAAALLNFGYEEYGIVPYPVNNLDLLEKFEQWRRQLSMNL